MKFYNSQRIGIVQDSWKQGTNDVKNIIVSKNVLNNNFNNSNNCKQWDLNCKNKKYKFNPNPIRHYRKQYTSESQSFSNNSFIGFFDKPGNYIVSEKNKDELCQNSNINIHLIGLNDECSPLLGDKDYDGSLNKTICIASNPQSMIIKRASTVLEDKYKSSNKEYLYKKCKTFTQNLPSNNDISTNNGTFTNCDSDGCRTTFNPSNRRYQVQGPVTSSSRIASLKYGCNKWEDNKPTRNTKCQINSDYNNPNLCPPNSTDAECINRKILSRPHCIGCPNDEKTIRRKRINILK